jgi:hypothetical protein
MTYKGKYIPKNPEKYSGDIKNIRYLSLWERQVFRFLDANPNVLTWSSESHIIPYLCKTDKKIHKYYIDVYYETTAGKKYLIEIKPEKETKPPKVPKRKTKRYLNECLTYAKNTSKWEAAMAYAEKQGFTFMIWTETALTKMGIRLTKSAPSRRSKS